jgi:hypothetical protein
MNQSLFLTPKVAQQEKTAGQVALGDDPSAWQTQILQELYKQVPYVADYTPHVVISKVDPDKGYALGHIEVVNKTQAPVHDMSTSQLDVAGLRIARIPIIVENKKLQPLDLLIAPGDTPKIVPLTERRLRAAIFRPNLGDTVSTSPGATSLIATLYPPYRQQFGFGSGGVISADAGKTASDGNAPKVTPKESMEKLCEQLGLTVGDRDRSTRWSNEKTAAAASVPKTRAINEAIAQVMQGKFANDPLLPNIVHSINPSDLQKFASATRDLFAQAQFAGTDDMLTRVLAPLSTYGTVKSASAIEFTPSVIQIRREGPNTYCVKMASHLHWAPEEHTLDRTALVRVFGAKVAMDTDMAGAATMAEESLPVEGAPSLEAAPEVVKTPGTYKVKNTEGQELIGLVFPNLLNFDGNVLPLALFTNGSATALQGEVCGLPAGGVTKIPEGTPQGHGAFYSQQADGTTIMMPPVDIQGTSTGPTGEGHFLAVDLDGLPRQIILSKGLERPVCHGAECLVPAHYKWLPLEENALVPLASTAAEFTKQASFSLLDIVVRSSGPESFTLTGAPLDKLAAEDRSMVGLDDAMFLLSAAGVHPETSVQKLAEAMTGARPVVCHAARCLSTVGVDHDVLEKAAELSAFVSAIKPPVFLTKEAAEIPDEQSADAILSLGFMNPENLGTFISHLPHFESTQAKLGEMLLAARVGVLPQVPRGSIERALRALEEVVVGLNALAFAA